MKMKDFVDIMQTSLPKSHGIELLML